MFRELHCITTQFRTIKAGMMLNVIENVAQGSFKCLHIYLHMAQNDCVYAEKKLDN